MIVLRHSFSVATTIAMTFAACSCPQAAEVRRAATADGRPGLVIIYDSSGSMWQRMPLFGAATEESRRYGVARRFTLTLVDRLAPMMPNHDVGLLMFGSRRPSDCEDRNVAVSMRAFSTGQADEIRSAVNRARPLGITPIAEAIKDASRLLEGRSSASIVLVSDGIEECNADPCAIAAEIKRSNARFVAHVIGVDVPSSIFGRISCIAEVTGGAAARIEGPDDFETALIAVINAARATAVLLTQIKATAQVRATEAFPGLVQKPRLRILGSAANAVDAPESVGALVTRVAPGNYRIDFQLGEEVVSKELNVTPDVESVTAEHVFEPGILAIQPLLPGGEPLEGQSQVLWRIELLDPAEGDSAPRGKNVVTYQAAELRIFVPPGRYRVTATFEDHSWNVAPEPISVWSGREAFRSFEMK